MKKVLSIVLSIAMVLCMMPAMAFAGTTSAQASAAYSDTAGTACEGAVNVLSALGVVDGYTDGTYKPEQVVTRAEMAKLIVTALGVDKYATATTSKFTDMGAASWAIPYVEYASNLNIVNGYGYGLFGPNDTVTYEQAVTMIVRALGYTDECKEMNGSWPAIYVQKATALGLFDDVVNGGSAGADRGDVAIMLFNALGCAEVYADNDGATQPKTGKTLTSYNGKDISGVTMMGVLNKNGTDEFQIVDNTILDKALYNVSAYVGTLAKVYKNENGDVIAIGEIKTELLKGTFNSDKDEFTVGDTKYRVASSALSTYVKANGNDGSKSGTQVDGTAVANEGQPQMLVSGDSTNLTSTVFNGIKTNQTVTLAARISGSTINDIYAVSTWGNKTAFMFKDSDASTISGKQKLQGKEFILDNDGEIDYDSFVLEGVDTLDDIAKDNVVYMYVDGKNKIRKVSVGTETVTGVLNTLTAGKAAAVGEAGKNATVEIDGTKYSTAYQGINSQYITDWYTVTDGDNVDLGDKVTAYLDASGKIYTFKQDEASSSDYALVLDATGIVIGTNAIYDAGSGSTDAKLSKDGGLSGNDMKIKLMNANGDANTYVLKDGVAIKLNNAICTEGSNPLSVADIVKVELNSAGEIKTVNIVYNNVDMDAAPATAKITENGYFDGQAIANNAVIFTVETTSSKIKGKDDAVLSSSEVIDPDDVSIAKYESVLDSTGVQNFGSVTKSGKYAAMVISSNATSSTLHFGIITEFANLKDDPSDKSYKVSMLMDGEESPVTYYTDITPVKGVLYQVKFDASGNINSLEDVKTSADATLLGVINATGNKIDNANNVVSTAKGTKVTIASDAIYYNYDGSWEVGVSSDLVNAKAGAQIYLVDTGKDGTGDQDKVADIVVIAENNANKAKYDTDATAPTATITSFTASGGELVVKSSEVGTVYYVVDAAGTATAPTAVEILAAGNEITIETANTDTNETISGTFNVSTSKVYIVAVDAAGNVSTVVNDTAA